VGVADFGDIDSDFGPATEGAVRRFQERNDRDADGMCGPFTLAKMDEIRAAALTMNR